MIMTTTKMWDLARLFVRISTVAVAHAGVIAVIAAVVAVGARFGVILLGGAGTVVGVDLPFKEDVLLYGFLFYFLARSASHAPFAVGTYIYSPFVTYHVLLLLQGATHALLWIFVIPKNFSMFEFIAVVYPPFYYLFWVAIIFPVFVKMPFRDVNWRIVFAYLRGMEITHAFFICHLLLFLACFYLKNQKASYNLNNEADSQQYKLYFLATVGMGILLPGLRVLSNMAASLTEGWKARTPTNAHDEIKVVNKNIVFNASDFWAGVQILIVFREVNLPYFVLSSLMSDSFFLADRIVSVILQRREARDKLGVNPTVADVQDQTDLEIDATKNAVKLSEESPAVQPPFIQIEEQKTQADFLNDFLEKGLNEENHHPAVGRSHSTVATKATRVDTDKLRPVIKNAFSSEGLSRSFSHHRRTIVDMKDVEEDRPPTPFTPMTAETHNALRRLALITNEWKGRLNAMLVTTIFLATSPTSEWFSCYGSFDIREAFKRAFIGVVNALVFDLVGFAIEMRFGNFDYTTALRSFKMNFGGVFYCSLSLSSIVGIWLMAETGISDANITTCYAVGRRNWHLT